jgi:hypothetical protein
LVDQVVGSGARKLSHLAWRLDNLIDPQFTAFDQSSHLGCRMLQELGLDGQQRLLPEGVVLAVQLGRVAIDLLDQARRIDRDHQRFRQQVGQERGGGHQGQVVLPAGETAALSQRGQLLGRVHSEVGAEML